MRIQREFEIRQRPDRVWTICNDIPTVAQCLPGAEIIDTPSPGTYRGKVTVRLGPFEMTFEGEGQVASDDAQRVMSIDGSGVDRRGGSRGQMKMGLSLTEHADGTSVAVDADIALAGAAAQFGRPGLIEELASRLIDDFVTCLEGKLDAASPSAATEVQAPRSLGAGMIARSFGTWLRRLFRGWFRRS